jgi:hypothetical protein
MNDFFSGSAWREHVRSATDKTRAMTAERATRISPAAMTEVLSALDDYWAAIESSDLKERSKGIYMSMADNFVRWMRSEFVPGSRSTVHGFPARRNQKSPERRRNVGDAVDMCRCGHSSNSHIYPGSALYGDCHHCECELYDPAGGLKGVPIHPLFAFTEDEYRMVSCAECGRFRVVPDGVCERCGWDNDNNGLVEQTRPQYCRHSPTRQHEVPSFESSHCRHCLQVTKAAPGTHGTHERWKAGCDCNKCRGAARQWISRCGISSSLAATLSDILIFRHNGNELWLTMDTLKKDVVRHSVDELVRIGILSKSTDESHRAGTYLIHFERLTASS